ncbi:MAG: hypothetical protein VX766_10350 [Pseudomonadota bacterium]|nr:hypothetical protein [Pseudomonadota bacterium]
MLAEARILEVLKSDLAFRARLILGDRIRLRFGHSPFGTGLSMASGLTYLVLLYDTGWGGSNSEPGELGYSVQWCAPPVPVSRVENIREWASGMVASPQVHLGTGEYRELLEFLASDG